MSKTHQPAARARCSGPSRRQQSLRLGVLLVVLWGATLAPEARANDGLPLAYYSATNFIIQESPRRRAAGALGRVQAAAHLMVHPAFATAWGRDGRLSNAELTNDFMSFGQDGVYAFNVLDADGYVEHYKCNLFAFELAYRAGLVVPVIGRPRGWGYPSPAELLRSLDEGSLDGRWATEVSFLSDEELTWSVELGVPLMLLADGTEGRAGHMGIVDELHSIQRDEWGNIIRVEYSGWEANGDAARYERRIWGPARFEDIYVLELHDPGEDEPQTVAICREPERPSRRDQPVGEVWAAADGPDCHGNC